MRITSKILLLFALTASVSCSTIDYEKDEHSVSLTNGDVTTKLTVMNDEIIRVEKSLVGSAAPKIPEYVVVMEPQDTKWKVKESGGKLVVETSKLKATINSLGEVSYTNKQGENIVAEVATDSYITPVSDGDVATAQSFTAGDEALYGLGQFQNGLINWRGTPLRLLQSNQEIAIPFMVSTAGYGIYWGNYGVTDFNISDKNQLSFTEVVDEKAKIKRGKFTPRISGVHQFSVVSPTPKPSNRRLGAMRLIIDQDTILNYTTMWFPDAMAGRANLEAGREYDVVFQDTGAQEVGQVVYNEPDYNISRFSNEHGEQIDYYLIYGEEPARVVELYSELTGKAPMLPKSAFGFWHCREAYREQATLLENAHEYRKRQIPVDNIVQDWDYWREGTRCPEWDRSRYPDPKGMVAELKDLNLNLLVSVWPAVDSKEHVERYGLEKLPKTSFINAFDPEVASGYYKMLSDSMYKIGVQAIWIDGSEPANHPDPKGDTGVAPYEQLANIYSQRVTGAVYEGHREEFPEKRVINLTRSGFAGQQRFGTMVWSGDVDGSWEQFREQIPAGLNLTATGLPYWTTDIGGFFRNMTEGNTIERDQYHDQNYIELLSRWFEYGTFCPIFRIHGFKSETEVWRFGAEFEALARKYIDLRYQLIPYIYSESHDVTTSGAVMMSPLAYQFPEDKNCWDVMDQFMFGRSILVSPVTEYGAREREMYLPEGEWFNLWNNDKLKGGKSITAKAEVGEMPIFVKAGAIIPCGPKVQYACEPTDEPMRIKIYPGCDGEFTLYLDDNASYGYESGDYSLVEMKYSESNGELTLASSHDKYVGFAKSPVKFVVECIGGGVQEVTFDGEKTTVKL